MYLRICPSVIIPVVIFFLFLIINIPSFLLLKIFKALFILTVPSIKGIFSSKGKIAQTRVLREAEHGTSDTKEIKSEHRLVQSIEGRKTIYCSPGHIVGFANENSDQKELIDFLISHQTKKDFSFRQAFLKGAFTVPGDGCIDYRPIFNELVKNNYQGWLVVEAEQDPSKANPFEYAKIGYNYLSKTAKECGFNIIS